MRQRDSKSSEFQLYFAINQYRVGSSVSVLARGNNQEKRGWQIPSDDGCAAVCAAAGCAAAAAVSADNCEVFEPFANTLSIENRAFEAYIGGGGGRPDAGARERPRRQRRRRRCGTHAGPSRGTADRRRRGMDSAAGGPQGRKGSVAGSRNWRREGSVKGEEA